MTKPGRNPISVGCIALVVTTALTLAACGGGAAPAASTTTPAPTDTSTTAPAVTTTTVPPATTTPALPPPSNSASEWTVGPATAEVPPGWHEAFTIGYGNDVSLLGSAPGGEGLTLGPDYGAQAPDGTWWFLDAAKQRLAHYDATGGYLDAVVLGEQFLASGIYFQYQLPRVLADGTLVAIRLTGDTTEFLTLAAGEPQLVSIQATLLAKVDDGRTVYGFDTEGALVAIDPVNGTWQPTEWFVTQSGVNYMVGLTSGGATVSLPDAAIEKAIPLTASNGPGAVHGLLEVATGADGVIHVLFLGISESDESQQLAGYATIGTNGTVSEMEPRINPFTPADPGSPSHLGIAYGSSTPWLMIVGETGVRVLLRQ